MSSPLDGTWSESQWGNRLTFDRVHYTLRIAHEDAGVAGRKGGTMIEENNSFGRLRRKIQSNLVSKHLG